MTRARAHHGGCATDSARPYVQVRRPADSFAHLRDLVLDASGGCFLVDLMGALGTLPSPLGMGGLARSHQKVTATWFEQTAVATAQTLYV
jgi:hypothetical protein